jgi:hypothetical protein
MVEEKTLRKDCLVCLLRPPFSKAETRIMDVISGSAYIVDSPYAPV